MFDFCAKESCNFEKYRHNVYMSSFNLNNFLNNALDYSRFRLKKPNLNTRNNVNNVNSDNPPRYTSKGESALNQPNPLDIQTRAIRNFKMNQLAGTDRATYIRNVMLLPKNLTDLIKTIQRTMPQLEQAQQIQQQILATTQSQIKNLTQQSQLLNQNINLNDISRLIQDNGKEAINKLIVAMGTAAKQGIIDASEIKETMKLINASVSIAGEKSSAQTLKSLILLYLPWLPLQEGAGFELEVEIKEKESGEKDTHMTILISTVNFGNIKVLLILTQGNSIDVFVTCSEKFPKEKLMKKLKEESQNHSLQSNISIEQKELKSDEIRPQQAKINMSQVTEVNPFMLLMAQALIRHTMEIDRNNLSD